MFEGKSYFIIFKAKPEVFFVTRIIFELIISFGKWVYWVSLTSNFLSIVTQIQIALIVSHSLGFHLKLFIDMKT